MSDQPLADDLVSRLESTDAYDAPSTAGYLMKDAAVEIERLKWLLKSIATCGELHVCNACRDNLMEFAQ